MKKKLLVLSILTLLLLSTLGGIARNADGSIVHFDQNNNQGGNQGGDDDSGSYTYFIAVTQTAHGTISPGTIIVNYGDSQTFTITPQAGYHVVGITVDGASQGAVTSYTFSNIDDDHTISATFAINTYTVSVGQVTYGSISSVNGTTANYGDNLQFAITPTTGYHIASITVDGSPVTVTGSLDQTYTFSAISANHTITATFTINTYTVGVGYLSLGYASTIGTTGQAGSSNNCFSQPLGVATDSAGNIYVADSNNDRIQKFSSNGTYLASIKFAPSTPPTCVAVDSKGNIYVTGLWGAAKLSSNGTYLYTLTPGADNPLFDCAGITIDSHDNVYVFEAYYLYEFSSNGTYLSQMDIGSAWAPGCVAVDSKGNIYVTYFEIPSRDSSDIDSQCVQEYSSSGQLLSTLGTYGVAGSDNSHFNDPIGLAVDAYDNLYVCDEGNNRVQEFSSSGQYLATLGVTGVAGSDNNHFNYPICIAIDSKGNVFITDQNNQRVQEYSLVPNFNVAVPTQVHGSITSSNGTAASYGDNLQFTITPTTGYHIASITVDNSSVPITNSAGQTYTFSNIAANHQIWAAFAMNSYTVTVGQVTDGSISSGNATTVDYGDNIQFTITPNAGYHIASITVDGSPVAVTDSLGQTYTFSDISADHTISATFNNTYQITVISAHGNPTNSATVTYGENFTASVTTLENAATGDQWICTGYSIDNGTLQTGSTYTFTNVAADHTITFQWQEQYYLTVNNGGVGTVSGQGWYNAGTVAQAQLTGSTVEPGTASGIQYVFSGWTGSTTSSATSLQVTMNSAETVTATWTTQYQVTMVCNQTQGKTTPSSAVWIASGASLSVTAQPNTGFAFNTWTTTGQVTLAAPTQSTTSATVTGPGTITANFAATTSSPATSNIITAIDTTDKNSYQVEVGGNVTAQQLSDMTITPNSKTLSTTVSFTITGTPGTHGLVNLTLPLAAIPYGSKPIVYIDGQLASIQGFSQDSSHFYVWFTTHFSTHQIQVNFTAQSASTNTPTPTVASTTVETATIPQLLALIAAVVVLVLVVFALVTRQRRKKGQS